MFVTGLTVLLSTNFWNLRDINFCVLPMFVSLFLWEGRDVVSACEATREKKMLKAERHQGIRAEGRPFCKRVRTYEIKEGYLFSHPFVLAPI